MTRQFLIALTLVLASAPARADKKKLTPAEAKQLVEETQERLRLDETLDEPVRVSGELRFLFDASAPAGVHQFVATSRDRWRQDVSLPGWLGMQLSTEETTWIWRHDDNQQEVTLLSTWAGYALEPRRLVAALANPAGRRVKGRDGSAQVELRTKGLDLPILRLDASTGALVSWKEGSLEYRFSGERSAGGRTWPAETEILSNGRAVLRVLVAEPQTGADQVPEALFEPPEGAERRVRADAEGLTPPRLLEAPQPVYPRDLKKQRIGGQVILRAVIGTDGRVHSAQVLAGAHPALDASALKAVQGRRYQPGLLDGSPVEVTSTIRINFALK